MTEPVGYSMLSKTESQVVKTRWHIDVTGDPDRRHVILPTAIGYFIADRITAIGTGPSANDIRRLDVVVIGLVPHGKPWSNSGEEAVRRFSTEESDDRIGYLFKFSPPFVLGILRDALDLDVLKAPNLESL